MDFDSKVSNFRKKALWKQLEGYKAIIALKEDEVRNCEKKKLEAERVENVVNLIISKIKQSSNIGGNANDARIHESLQPLKDLLSNSNLRSELNESLDFILALISSQIIGAQKKIIINDMGSEANIQKDLQISEMETKLAEAVEKAQLLESKIFSLEKTISSLNNFKKGENDERPVGKRAKTSNESEVAEASPADTEVATKLSVASAELEALKSVAAERLKEIEFLYNEKKRLSEELESREEQIRKIPQEFMKDYSSFRQMNDDIRRYKNDLHDAISTIKSLEKEVEQSAHRNKKIISQLERDVKEKYTKLEDFVKTTDSEIARLRKDRDAMRQMYEQSNALLASSQKQLTTYQKNINCSESAINQLTRTVSTLKSHIETIPKLELKGNEELSKALEGLRADEQLYVEELENLGKAFEHLQSENAALVKKMAERDDQISKLLGDKLKAEFSFSQIQREAESSLERAQKIEEIAKHRISEIEIREDNLRRQVSTMDKDISDHLIALSNFKSRLSEASAENSYLKSKIEKLMAEISDLKELVPSSGQKDQLAFEKRRLVEELAVATKKLDAYSASGVGLVKELEEELNIYKKLMKCNSCHTRDKNAVILKCMHCFCKTCLDIRLETRQRKCPNCGDPFGASDVKQIFL